MRLLQAMGARLKLRLVKLLPDGEPERIVDGALRVLERVGVACSHRGFIERLTSYDGVRFEKGKLLFSAELVSSLIDELKGGEPGEEGFSVHAPWCAMALFDHLKGEVREARTEDAVRMTKFCDAMGLKGGPIPVIPSDVPRELLSIVCERICLLNSRGLGGGLPVRRQEEVEVLAEMNLAAGRRYNMVIQFVISPLRFDDEAVDLLLKNLENPDLNLYPAGPIPMAGLSAPLPFPAAIVQSLAESLACYLSVRLLSEGRLRPFELRVEPFDMRYMTLVYGSPEWCIFNAVAREVYEHITGRPNRWGSFRSASKRPDQQAAAERTASVILQAIMGARRFGAVGQLSVDEVFSPQQALIDREILAYVSRLMEGLELGDGGDPLELIAEGARRGGYLDHPSTLKLFRRMYWDPELFKHWSLKQWLESGSPSLEEITAEQVERMIAEHRFELEPGAREEIDRIFEKAVQILS